jgi:hypothetical protein
VFGLPSTRSQATGTARGTSVIRQRKEFCVLSGDVFLPFELCDASGLVLICLVLDVRRLRGG